MAKGDCSIPTMDVSGDGRWFDGPMVAEESFSIGSMVEVRWSTTAVDESMIKDQWSMRAFLKVTVQA